MKKTFMLPLLAAIAGLVLAFTTSAFKGEPKDCKEKGKYITRYFQYSGNDTEAQYEDTAKWMSLPALPGSDPCSGANNIVCVLNTEDIASDSKEDLVTFLKSLPGTDGAEQYCRNNARINFRKP